MRGLRFRPPTTARIRVGRQRLHATRPSAPHIWWRVGATALSGAGLLWWSAAAEPKHAAMEEVDLGRHTLADGEHRLVTLPNGSTVLLSRRSGRLAAVCAPGGVLDASATVVGDTITTSRCVRFHVQTGALLGGPALDDLQLLRVRVDARGHVVVSIPRATAEPVFGKDCHCAGERQVVIVGAGAAGVTAAQTLRQEGFQGRIIMVDKDPELPYDRTQLSKVLDATPLRSDAFYKANDIELWRGRSVSAINVTNQSVSFEDGAELHYDELVVATGGVPRLRTIAGAEGQNVYLVRTMADVQRITERIDSNTRVVVLGSSFIGMETAATLKERAGVNSVEVVGVEDVSFENSFGSVIGRALQSWHESHGVKFSNASNVARISSDSQGRVTSVDLVSGTQISADAVILGLGISPASQMCRPHEFKLDRWGFIVVDRSMHAAPHVWAVGDVCSFPYFDSGAPVNVQHWAVAQQQARVAARNIANPLSRVEYAYPSYFWTEAYGKTVHFIGTLARGWDSLVLDGDPESLAFRAFYVHNNRVVAALLMGRDAEAPAAMELFIRDRMPSAAQLAREPSLSLLHLAREVHQEHMAERTQ